MRPAPVAATLILAIVLAILAVWGAGVFPVALLCAVLLLCIAVFMIPPPAFAAAADGKRRRFARLPAVAIFGLALMGVLAVTALPLPGRVDRAGGVRRFRDDCAVRAAVDDARAIGLKTPVSIRFSISRNRSGTLRSLLLAIAAACAAVVAGNLSARMQRGYLGFLAILGLVVGVAGHINQWYWPSPGELWWMFPVPHGHHNVGCFVSRAHFGGFVAMSSVVAGALAIGAARDRRWITTLLWVAVLGATGVAAVASLSRGAALAWAAGMCCLGVFEAMRRRLHGVAVAILAAAVVVAAMTALPAVWRPVVARLAPLSRPLDAESAQARLQTWRDGLKVWRSYPLVGAGANAFRTVFSQHRDAATRESFYHAENEYVEVLADTGLLGVVLWAGLAVFAVRRWRSNALAGALATETSLAFAAASAVAGVHALFDFALHNPLYAVEYASLMGLALSRVGANPEGREAKDCVAWPRVLSPRLLAGVVALCVAAAWPLSSVRSLETDSPDVLASLDAPDTMRALAAAPTYWYAWWRLADHACSFGTREAYQFGERCLSRATALDPMNYRLWYQLSLRRLALGDRDGADSAFERAHALRPWLARPALDERQRIQ